MGMTRLSWNTRRLESVYGTKNGKEGNHEQAEETDKASGNNMDGSKEENAVNGSADDIVSPPLAGLFKKRGSRTLKSLASASEPRRV